MINTYRTKAKVVTLVSVKSTNGINYNYNRMINTYRTQLVIEHTINTYRINVPVETVIQTEKKCII
jgi:hypothetical protein